MSDEIKKPSVIDDALAEIGRVAFIEPAICTGWVLVSEWMGDSAEGSDYWTLTLADDLNPDWRLKGLLRHALEEWGDNEVRFKDSDEPKEG